jgi:glycogen debranching enzyme
VTRAVRRIPWPGRGPHGLETLLDREWLVTNGLGGYASGTIAGVPTRRFHGLLIAALPAPYGRTMILNQLVEQLVLGDGRTVSLGGEERTTGFALPTTDLLAEFRLELGLPTWTYRVGPHVLEKQLLLLHGQNTVHVTYRLLDGPELRLRLRPGIHFRPHEAPLHTPRDGPYRLSVVEDRYEIAAGDALPVLKLRLHAPSAPFTFLPQLTPEVVYRVEESRGYDSRGDL